MARLGNRGKKDAYIKLVEITMVWIIRNTLEANFVPLQTVHGLDEEGLAS